MFEYRILVCGCRDYGVPRNPKSLESVEIAKRQAYWNRYGKTAGFKRNTKMLEEGKPDIVVAFKGGVGTNMMCTITDAAGVRVDRTWEKSDG